MTGHRGDYCGWAYCAKWGSIVVEHMDESADTERMWVCLTHQAHAHVRGWVTVWPEGAAPPRDDGL